VVAWAAADEGAVVVEREAAGEAECAVGVAAVVE
jgi:hypothetical protein